MDTATSHRPRHPIHRFPLAYLLIIPVLLSILTALTLFMHSDTTLPILYSQCHARSRLPLVTHSPVLPSFLATPLCFLVSFFQEAVASSRAAGVMAAVLSFVGGLLTVSTVEAARVCNGPSMLIAYPTGAWLVFNLAGGAIVWELVILPAFFHRSKAIVEARRRGATGRELASGGGGGGGGGGATDPNFGEAMRHLERAVEVVAIPVGVALGYVVPSVVMLATKGQPLAVLVWLLFPVWVTVVRQLVRKGMLTALNKSRHDGEAGGEEPSWWAASFHLEESRVALAAMYALPVLCSVVSHGLLVWSLVGRDDRKEMTRATEKFIVIDVFFIGLTVLYWLVVESGWRVVAVVVAVSVVLGPGAGICVGWVYRERMVDLDRSVTVVAVGSRRGSNGGEGAAASEETPLLG
ncbi:hypothetical protein B0T17DRAFT_611188 [Bombardia bombarda]|uniref:Uncharacterized protein n=1 Tax=Bombardia bombarda TaxID=252184 RepID=A0AA39TLI7_9PEZI|nr:hypothetical protein B0T17DRAFT_611188 [Bombardia bombarda]